MFTRRATLALDFIVVGASIAGLACAYNLHRAGHRVRVLDKLDGIGGGKGINGIRVPPNLTRLLYQWGLGPELLAQSTKCPGMAFKDGRSGETNFSIIFHEEILKELEADFQIMHYADLHKMLYDLVVSEQISVEFDKHVVEVNAQKPSITLDSGEEFSADIIVGADGRDSVVLGIIGKPNSTPRPDTGYFCTVPRCAIQNAGLEPLINDSMWSMHMGNGGAVHTHVVRGGSELSVTISLPGASKHSESWTKQISAKLFDFSEYGGRIQDLMSLVDEVIEVAEFDRTPLEDWFNSEGTVVVLGDAAHVISSGTTHTQSMAVEDGAALGAIFSRLRDREQIIPFLAAFQDLRQPRCDAVIQNELGKVQFCSLPTGPAQEMRDASLRELAARASANFEDSDEAYLRGQWEEFITLFSYDAYDEVDNWWVEWGALRDLAEKRKPMNVVNFEFQVSQDGCQAEEGVSNYGPQAVIEFEGIAVYV